MKNTAVKTQENKLFKIRFKNLYNFKSLKFPFADGFCPCDIVKQYAELTNVSSLQVYATLVTLNPKVFIKNGACYIGHKSEWKLIKALTNLPPAYFVYGKGEITRLIKHINRKEKTSIGITAELFSVN